MRKFIKTIPVIMFFWLTLASSAAAQSGGQFAVTQSVIANGGGNYVGGNFGVTGTTAQTNVGANPVSGNFGLRDGFWQAFFAPTAAQVSVSGKVLAANGSGISNVRVSMTNQAGETQTAVSNTFGNFRFETVAAGEIYVFTVISRRYQFSVPSQVLSVNDNINDLVFIANW